MSDQQPPATPSPGPGDPDPSARPTGDPTAPQPGPPPQPWEPSVAPGAYGAPPPGPYGGQPWYPGGPAAWPAPAYPGGWFPPGLDPNDPLVNPPGAGVGGWWARCVGAVRRGWPLLVPILLLTQVLPAALMSLLSLAVDPTARWDADLAENADALPDTFLADLAAMLGVLVGALVVFGLVQAVGWAAGTWVVARQAAGEPVSLGGALRHGARRALGLWGWSLLVGVLVGVGVCFCVLPGIYLVFALSLAGPVYLFERQNPIGRAFRMFHERLGLVLGRMALVAVAFVVVSVVAGIVEAVGGLPFGVTPLDSPGTAVGIVVVSLTGAVLALPAYLAQLVGLVVTYAEQRACEGPVNAARLAAELG
ncbi:hypothetical protein [Micromonospora sp. NPDC049497]|uniref:hypothetical protein n=1 Tax=Micromonospora sp. NPDC049497 TaxID=3364273 RepID=UPI0037A882A1